MLGYVVFASCAVAYQVTKQLLQELCRFLFSFSQVFLLFYSLPCSERSQSQNGIINTLAD
jgi:hypothetical protein